MHDVTQILAQIDQGDTAAADRLLPLVYQELRRLAARRLDREPPGQTLQATALVHEAYLRLANVAQPHEWRSRAHFFGAAAEAMRRILVESARSKQRLKRGGGRQRQEMQLADLNQVKLNRNGRDVDVQALDEALTLLAEEHPQQAELVKLRYFAGLTLAESAAALDVSTATAERHWRYARAWLAHRLRSPAGES